MDSYYYMRVDADNYTSMKTCLILSSILNENKKIPFIYGDMLQIDKNLILKNFTK